MTELWIGYGIVLLIMFIGVMGNLIPGIPGTPLILAGAVGHQLYFAGQGDAGWGWVAVLAAFGLLALGLDYLATLIGAKKLGATWKGMIGAVLGVIVGVFVFPPIGLIVGPFVGAMGFEWAFGREARESAKAGVGAVLGLALGVLGKLICSVVMMALFAFAAWPSGSALPAAPMPTPIVEKPAGETAEPAED
ncbi:MAG: DUF456 domain-containing protein [Verrucomicrobiota bacterium]|jgi:hypothetical protein|nr:DUF456 domain-containing protein [Verrucomicrobiota bacterium]MDP7048483.1 DUF456 domain-containing protein [Verrucomicrobiota bacterium]